MSPVEVALLAAAEACRTELTESLLNEWERAPPVPGQVRYPREALEQFINAFFLMLEETLRQGVSEARDFYMTTAMPAVRDGGLPVKLLMSGSAGSAISISIALSSHLPADHRAAGSHWLAKFFGDYLGDLAALWVPSHG